MVSMEEYQQLSERGVDVGRREYSTHIELIADFGPAADPSVDIVDNTAIVVNDGETIDIELDGSAQAFIRNGILTIEVKDEVDA